MPGGGRATGSFTGILEPYLELRGVRAAALVSSEGLMVAEAGASDYDFQALGAHAAATLSHACDLASELGNPSPSALSLNLSRLGLVLMPLNSELFLILAGESSILALAAGGAILP